MPLQNAPLQNRVTPLGELIAVEARGLVYGNRGCLHDADRRIRRFYAVKRWIACRLEFRGWHRRPLMQPGRFTELFFLDEATALAAGHRPCALCRYEDYTRLTDAWRELHPRQRGADAIDAQLQAERLVEGTRRRRFHVAPVAGLPDGTFVLLDDVPHVLAGGLPRPWSPAGYGPAPRRRPAGSVRVVTPPSLVALLARGWEPLVPLLHPSALSTPVARLRR